MTLPKARRPESAACASPAAPAVPERWRPAVAEAWRALWVSRVVVWLSALGAIAVWGDVAAGAPPSIPADADAPLRRARRRARRADGPLGQRLVPGDRRRRLPGAPTPRRPAFFPLYPWLVRVAGAVTGSPLIAGALLSTACFAGALAVLHRLAELELGPEAARWTVWALALFPMSFFFSAVYAEALFLLLSVGAVYAGRTGRWAWAGALGGLAAATRSAGLVLVVAARAAVVAAARPACSRQLAWLALIPAAQAAFCALLALRGADALAPFHAQALWYRSFAGPFVGLWDGAVAACRRRAPAAARPRAAGLLRAGRAATRCGSRAST